VLAIKQTLYRTSVTPPSFDRSRLLLNQEKRCLLSSKSIRFDEQNNITWARQLERAGVHVVYGLVGLKTHCKLTQVVRREKSGISRRMAHRNGKLQPKDEPHLRRPWTVHELPPKSAQS